MDFRSLLLRIKPIKQLAYKGYKEKKQAEYSSAFKKRLQEIRTLDINIEDKLNVLIVVADCLRFKNTSISGYERDTTPFISSLKNSGKAVAAAPWTHPSVASIMTGMYPHNHRAYIHSKVRNFDNPKNIKGIRRTLLTLPEIAALNGYGVYFSTAIEVASFPMKGRTPIEMYPGETRGEKVITDFFKWLDSGQKNFFAYLHLGDTHEPLHPPKEFKDYFGRVERLKGIERWAFQRADEQKGESFEKFKENKLLLYDNTVRYVDWLFQQVHDGIERRDLLDNTLVIFTADHGEEFWEHAKMEAENFFDPRGVYGVGHGHNVFNEITEVPLALDGPIKGLKFNNRSLTDIFPTITSMWGVKLPYKVDGRPLTEQPQGFLLTEASGYGYEKKAFVVKNLKLLYAPDDGVEWLFLSDSDKNEQKPIKQPELTSELRKKLLSILARDEVRNKSLKRNERDDAV